MTWKDLDAVAPTDLVEARLQLHHAAQIVASAGVTFLESQPDDSHPNFGWVEGLGALVGRRLPMQDVQVGLRVADLSLSIIEKHGRVREEFALSGRTLEDGYAWLTAMTAPVAGLTRATYEIPQHETGNGGTFAVENGDAFAELSRWFGNAHEVFADLAKGLSGSSEVRCWPHHFDLGMLVVVETGPDGRLAKSIGIGLSPGDESYAEPYAYVSPWPYPDANSLPPLGSGGEWHTEGYTSAILTGSEIVVGPVDHQRDRLQGFLDAAIDASRKLLATPAQA